MEGRQVGAKIISRPTTPERFYKTSQGWLSEKKVIDLLARKVRLELKETLSPEEEKSLRLQVEGHRAKLRLKEAEKALKALRPHVRVK